MQHPTRCAGVGGVDHERGRRHRLVEHAQTASQAAHERGFPRAQVAFEEDHFPALEFAGELRGDRFGLGLGTGFENTRHGFAQDRPSDAIARGKASATSPATTPQGRRLPARSPARPWT